MPNIYRIFSGEDRLNFFDEVNWDVVRTWMAAENNILWFIQMMGLLGLQSIVDILHLKAYQMANAAWYFDFEDVTKEVTKSENPEALMELNKVVDLFSKSRLHYFGLVSRFAYKVGRFIITKNGTTLSLQVAYGEAPTFEEVLGAFQDLGILQAIFEASVPDGTNGFLSDACTGMSGRKDWYFMRVHSLGPDDWATGEHILHISCMGKLNEGLKCQIWQLGMLLRRHFRKEVINLLVRKDEDGEIRFNQPSYNVRNLIIPRGKAYYYANESVFSEEDWLPEVDSPIEEEPTRKLRPRKNRPVEDEE